MINILIFNNVIYNVANADNSFLKSNTRIEIKQFVYKNLVIFVSFSGVWTVKASENKVDLGRSKWPNRKKGKRNKWGSISKIIL